MFVLIVTLIINMSFGKIIYISYVTVIMLNNLKNNYTPFLYNNLKLLYIWNISNKHQNTIFSGLFNF